MFEFQAFWWLSILPVPYLVWRFVPPAETSRTTIYLATASAYTELAENSKPHEVRIYTCWLLWSLLIVAAMRPVYLGAQQTNEQSARDLMLAVDISGSMERRDMLSSDGRQLLNRLQVVKLVMARFIVRRKGDRIGLVLFGDEAYLQAPLTLDTALVSDLLQESTIGLAGKNTAIGDAIALAVKKLAESNNKHAVIILLTDGADTASSIQPLQAATIAKKQGIKIYTVGVVPSYNNSLPSFFSSANSDLDENLLKEIARVTNGSYFRASNWQQLQATYQEIDALEKVIRNSYSFRPEKQLYFYPLGLVLLLIVGYLCWWLIQGQIKQQYIKE